MKRAGVGGDSRMSGLRAEAIWDTSEGKRGKGSCIFVAPEPFAGPNLLFS